MIACEKVQNHSYTLIAELPGGLASREQLSRLYHRYRTAACYAQDKDVLEVGCGAGQGLGYLARRARSVVGGDYTDANLRHAQRYYNGRARLVRLDAHRLPFPDGSFDLVVLFEAIYYLGHPEDFLQESRRVLRDGGMLLVSTVNRDWVDFSPSLFSTRYFSAPDLAASLRRHFEVQLHGAYPVPAGSTRENALSMLKRIAVALGLMPRTMKSKEIFKRLFLGKLAPIPAEVWDDMAEYVQPAPIPAEVPDRRHKILYAIARVCRGPN